MTNQKQDVVTVSFGKSGDGTYPSTIGLYSSWGPSPQRARTGERLPDAGEYVRFQFFAFRIISGPKTTRLRLKYRATLASGWSM